MVSKEIEIDQLKSEVKRQRSTIDRLERTISGLEERLDKAIGNIIEIADTMRWRFEPQNWRKALSRLIDNPIAPPPSPSGRTWLGGSRRTRVQPTGSSSAR